VAELRTVLRLDARRTMILIAVPVLAGLGVAVAWQGLIPGVASWDCAVAAVGTSVRLLGPLAATLAAWATLRAERLDYLRTLGTRSPAVGPLLDLLLLCGVAMVAYVVVALVILADTLVHPAAPGFHPLGLLAGAAALLLCVVAGYLAGRLVPRPQTVAVVAMLTAAWSALRPAGWSWLSLLPPASVGPVGLYAGLRPGLAADQLLWSLGLATALVAGYLWTLSQWRPLMLPIALALGVTAVSTVRLHGYGGSATVRTQFAGQECRSWPLTVCVHPALLPALPSLEAVATPLATRLAGTPGGFRVVRQLPDQTPAGVRRGVAWVHVADLAPGYERRTAQELVAGLHTRCQAPYEQFVDAWLLDAPAPQPGGGGALRRFEGWNEAQRQAWLRHHYLAYRRCALRGADFQAVAPAPARSQDRSTAYGAKGSTPAPSASAVRRPSQPSTSRPSRTRPTYARKSTP